MTMYVVPPGPMAKREFYSVVPEDVLYTLGNANMLLFGFVVPGNH